MSSLSVSLFGKFSVGSSEPLKPVFEVNKVQELFCYLLLHRDRPHARETLADLLWSDSPAQSRNYLRKTLWQLQTALELTGFVATHTLSADANCLQLNSQTDLWIDVAVFESTCNRFRGIAGRQLTPQEASELQMAAILYQGDLLEGWYQEWCLYERERLQQLYLILLDKLIGYCEVHENYESGLVYGAEILRYDKARERTHRSLMRLFYLAGDRTGALRQFERCQAVLQEELGVKPATRTLKLYEQICADQLLVPPDTNKSDPLPQTVAILSNPSLPEILQGLKQLQTHLNQVQYQVQADIKWVEGQLQKAPLPN